MKDQFAGFYFIGQSGELERRNSSIGMGRVIGRFPHEQYSLLRTTENNLHFRHHFPNLIREVRIGVGFFILTFNITTIIRKFPFGRNENEMEVNLQRMIRLADEFFETKNDPDQISVTEIVMSRLGQIHPSTLSEKRDENGPFVWILILPTTQQLMEEFITEQITERELLEKTPTGASYDAVYLCSALVLPEYRGKGFARGLAVDAVRSVQHTHPIKELFCWPFSVEGKTLAHAIARELNLPLRQRSSHKPGQP